MLKRLAEAHPNAVAQLTLQYRMHHEICSIASQAIYNGRMIFTTNEHLSYLIFQSLTRVSIYCHCAYQVISSVPSIFLGSTCPVFPSRFLCHGFETS